MTHYKELVFINGNQNCDNRTQFTKEVAYGKTDTLKKMFLIECGGWNVEFQQK